LLRSKAEYARSPQETTMVRFILISVGSRGDAEPFCSLAAELLKQQHEHADHDVRTVDLFLQQDLLHLAPSSSPPAAVSADTTTTTNNNKEHHDKNRLRLHTLPFTQNDFYRYAAGGASLPGANHPNPRVQFVSVVAEIIGELVLPCSAQLSKVVVQEAAAAVDNNDDKDGTIIILSSSLARQLVLGVAAAAAKEKNSGRVVVGLVQLQPLQPVRAFPHYSHVDACVHAILELQNRAAQELLDSNTDADSNLETYWEPERFQHEFLQERLTKMYASSSVLRGAPVPDFEKDIQPILVGERHNVVIVNAFSNHLIPVVGTNNNTWDVGPLADAYVDPDWIPDPNLVEFLKAHPVCVGFGSMPFGNVRDVLQALQELDCQAVLVGQCFVSALSSLTTDGTNKSSPGQLSNEWLEENVYTVSNAPYPWLLPQCSMMLSHGGAGVVHAVLRAGIPHVVAPMMGDQFFFAKLLAAKKLGVIAASTLMTMTKDDVVNGIRQADHPIIRQSTHQLGQVIGAKCKTGVEQLAHRLLLEAASS